jgi:hypothetical protein
LHCLIFHSFSFISITEHVIKHPSKLRMGENVAAVEAADQSREAPKTADSSRAVPEQGLKRAAPEQGMSDRPVKKARVHSKM